MAVGFKSYSDSGSVQIGDDYVNMSLMLKGVGACNTQMGSVAYLDVTVTGINPIPAWRSNFPIALGTITKNGNQTTFRFWCNFENMGNQFTYYIFDWPETIAAGNYGLKVWTAANRLAFDSTMKWFRVVAVVNAGVASSTGTYTQLPTDRVYAVTPQFTAYGWRYYQLGGEDSFGNVVWVVSSYTQAFYTLSNGIAWDSVKFYRDYQITAVRVPPPDLPSTGPGSAVVIDVTSY